METDHVNTQKNTNKKPTHQQKHTKTNQTHTPHRPWHAHTNKKPSQTTLKPKKVVEEILVSYFLFSLTL